MAKRQVSSCPFLSWTRILLPGYKKMPGRKSQKHEFPEVLFLELTLGHNREENAFYCCCFNRLYFLEQF